MSVRLLWCHGVRIVWAYCDVPVWELCEDIVMSVCENCVRSSLWGHCEINVMFQFQVTVSSYCDFHEVCVRSLWCHGDLKLLTGTASPEEDTMHGTVAVFSGNEYNRSSVPPTDTYTHMIDKVPVRAHYTRNYAMSREVVTGRIIMLDCLNELTFWVAKNRASVCPISLCTSRATITEILHTYLIIVKTVTSAVASVSKVACRAPWK